MTKAAGMRAAGQPALKVAYVMSRFPKLTETFILTEIIAVEAAGADVEIYPLLRERERAMHPEARALVERAHYLPFVSPAIIGSHLALLASHPRRYLATFAAVLRGTWGSANFFLGAIGIWPKVGHAARMMRSSGVQHVHCHFATHPALAGFIIGRLTGIPFSFTAHGSDLHVDRRMLCTKVREARFVVTVSDANRAVFIDECGGPIPKLEVIRCGIDTRLFALQRDTSDPADTRREAPLRILIVGTLHEVKGQAYLLEAIARLAPDGPPVICRVVGDGPDRAALERLATERGIADRVTFLGQRPRAEVAGLMADSDVLVVPSVPTAEGKREGLPVVIAEAMGVGLPVVASRLSGIPELVIDGETGFLTPPGDASAIADALERLRADPHLGRSLGRAGRALVERDYDMSANALQLIDRFRPAAAS